jgi:hypothetical protein
MSNLEEASQWGRMGNHSCKATETEESHHMCCSFKTYAHEYPHKLCSHINKRWWGLRRRLLTISYSPQRRPIVKVKDTRFLKEWKPHRTGNWKPRTPVSTHHWNAEDLSSLVGGSKGYVFIHINKMLLRNILFPEHLASWFWKGKKKSGSSGKVGKRTKAIGILPMK